MINAAFAHPTPSRRAHSRLSRLATAGAEVLHLLAAAIRATRAVEARRDPSPADLRTLGITTKLPAAW